VGQAIKEGDELVSLEQQQLIKALVLEKEAIKSGHGRDPELALQ